MRPEIIELGRLGPLPCCEEADDDTLKKFQDQITSIREPITNEEGIGGPFWP